MFTERQRKRIENMITWAEARVTENVVNGRPGAANHHRAKASALRAALAEIDMLKKEVESERVWREHAEKERDEALEGAK